MRRTELACLHSVRRDGQRMIAVETWGRGFTVRRKPGRETLMERIFREVQFPGWKMRSTSSPLGVAFRTFAVTRRHPGCSSVGYGASVPKRWYRARPENASPRF